WKLAKEKGERLYKVENGGSHDVFNQRPISEDLLSYCDSDVRYPPELRDIFCMQRAYEWRDLVDQES
ncbi:hypothetical protein J3E72DRAFT_191265, partial [Bipolaris maydis]